MMSTTELEAKCREFRQLQNLIAEAEQEMETIKDAIKAHSGDSTEAFARGVHGDVEAGEVLPGRRGGPAHGNAGRGPGVHQNHHHEAVLRGMRAYYKTCPHCGANLDPGESCDCIAARYECLTPENRGKFDAMIAKLLEEQNAAQSAANALGGGVDKALTGPDSTSHDNRK